MSFTPLALVVGEAISGMQHAEIVEKEQVTRLEVKLDCASPSKVVKRVNRLLLGLRDCRDVCRPGPGGGSSDEGPRAVHNNLTIAFKDQRPGS